MTFTAPLPYVVFGVTGRTGAATAAALLRAGHLVRVVVRDPAAGDLWAERGAQVAVADLTDLTAMTAALSGARAAYLLCPQDYGRGDLFERADLVADVAAHAVLAASVPKLVALSSIGADRESGTGWIAMNRVFEQYLRRTGIPTVFLRAAYFMENWMALVALALRDGTLPTFLAPPGHALAMVATDDVGHAAAALLQEDWTGNRIVTLAGPRDYAPNDVATVIAARRGTPVGVAVLAEADWPQALAGAGFTQAALAGFVELTRGLNSGHIDTDSDPSALAWAGTTPLARVLANNSGKPDSV